MSEGATWATAFKAGVAVCVLMTLYAFMGSLTGEPEADPHVLPVTVRPSRSPRHNPSTTSKGVPAAARGATWGKRVRQNDEASHEGSRHDERTNLHSHGDIARQLRLNSGGLLNDTSPEISCDAVRRQHLAEYMALREKIDFSKPPEYGMPWFFHDPHPVCGKYMLSNITEYRGEGPLKHVYAVSVRASTTRMTEGVAGEVIVRDCSEGAEERAKQALKSRGNDTAIDAVARRSLAQPDTFITVRFMNDNGMVPSRPLDESLPSEYYTLGIGSDLGTEPVPVRRFPFVLSAAGEYKAEVKLTHVNGTHEDPTAPRCLGVIGIRGRDKNNKKIFKYNHGCDKQRNLHGSPFKVVVAPRPGAVKRRSKGEALGVHRCTATNYTFGRWVRKEPSECAGGADPACIGDSAWLTDAAGFNDRLVWVPVADPPCRYRYLNPQAATFSENACAQNGRTGRLLIVGDSIMREYAKNCLLFKYSLPRGGLSCDFNNIAVEGQHYTEPYARSVAEAVANSARQRDVVVFGTNLGLLHMIGPCTTSQWIQYVTMFAAVWNSTMPKREDGPVRRFWIGPPSIQYARRGMGYQRGALWDQLAFKILEPLGFERLYAIGVTRAREEATWDGLHYAAQRNKPQTVLRKKGVPVYEWNGGVANMLFTVLLNSLCNLD